jgi:hypothetical protein
LLTLADPEAAPDVDAHLGGCAACQAFAATRVAFDTALSAAMRSVPLPAGGADRMYGFATRHRSQVVRRRWLVGTAVAAAVAAAGPLGFLGWLRTRPALDTTAVAQQFDRRRDDPEGFAAAWLTARGLPPALPRRFDYRFLHNAVLADLDGKPTPCVQFVRDRDSLDVYVVARTRLRLSDVAAAQGSFATVLPVPESPDHPGVGYLLVYTSPTLDTFLRPADPGL